MNLLQKPTYWVATAITLALLALGLNSLFPDLVTLRVNLLIIGFILGIVVSTVGFSGIARMADKGVDKVKEVTIEQAK